jgi:threonine/homoserine/homoserine lactone efflux protein
LDLSVIRADDEDMTSFAISALLLIMVPGPDQALVTRNCLVGGRRAGLLTVLGGVSGVSIHACAATAGLSAVLMASATAFTVLKIVGAAYLVWIGIQMLRSARHASGDLAGDEQLSEARRPGTYLRQGFLSNALNPKVALFFLTFLPQFISAGATSQRTQGLLLSAVFAGLYLAWFGGYVAAVDRLGRWMRRPRVRARVERVAAALMLTVAVRLATAAQ